MGRRKQNVAIRGEDDISSRSYRPSTTIEGRENQLIALAVDLAEKQLREGTASSQVITHYLKLGSTTERLEQKMKQQKIELDAAKTEMIQSSKRIEELYANAIAAMKSYSSQDGSDDDYADL